MTATTSPAGFGIDSHGSRLEAEWIVPPAPLAVAVLSHPHPLYGGDMRNPLMTHLFERLPEFRIATLRFNFRGVGESSGVHDGGVAEVHDVSAAFSSGVGLVSDAPLLSIGWSFGAIVSLNASHQSLCGWIAVAPPLTQSAAHSTSAMTDARPKLILVPEHDQFCKPATAEALTRSWTETSVVTLEGTDHSTFGRFDDVVDAAQTMVESCLPQ